MRHWASKARAWLADPRSHRWLAGVALGITGTFLIWSRFVGLDQGLWVDEIQSRVRWSSKGPFSIYDRFNENDHILYNLLTSFTTHLAHSSSEALIRFWSAFAGLGSAAILGVWSWRRFGPLAAALLVFLLTTSPVHMEHTRDARGWGLLFLPTAALVVCADHLLRKNDRLGAVGVGIAGFAGIATLPIFGAPFVGTLLALLVRPELRRKVVVAGGAALLAAAIFYAPVATHLVNRAGHLTGPKPGLQKDDKNLLEHPPPGVKVPTIVKEHRFPNLSAGDAVTELFQDVLDPTIELVVTGDVVQLKACQYKCYRGSQAAFYALIGAIAVGLGIWALWRRRETGLLLVLTVPIVLTYLAMYLIDATYFSRYGSFLLVHALVLVTVGVVELARVARRIPGGQPAVVGATLAVCAVMLVGAGHVALTWIAAPKEAFKELGQIVNQSGIQRVVTNSRRTTDLDYYVEPEVDRMRPAELVNFLCTYRGPLVFIDHPFFADSPPQRCLRASGAVRIELPQRKRGAKMIVWLRGAKSG